MTLRLRHGDVDLTIGARGYQFPTSDGSCDADWLDVGVALRVGDRSFERVDPCLTAGELARLALWLRRASELAFAFEAWAAGAWGAGPARLRSRLGFTEPCLQFEVRSGQPVVLRVRLRHELRPTFLDGWLEFPVGGEGLADAGEAVRAMAESHPPRRGTAR